MFIYQGKKISIDTPVTYDGVNYNNLRDPSVRALLGVVEVPDPVYPDTRFYTVTENTDGTINSTLKDIDSIKSTRLQELATLRYQKETSGILLNGSSIQTDRDAQAQINGALSAFANGFITVLNWKSASGFVQLDQVTVTAIAQAVATHVQACFTNESTHAAAINSLIDPQLVIDYDITTGWPV